MNTHVKRSTSQNCSDLLGRGHGVRVLGGTGDVKPLTWGAPFYLFHALELQVRFCLGKPPNSFTTFPSDISLLPKGISCLFFREVNLHVALLSSSNKTSYVSSQLCCFPPIITTHSLRSSSEALPISTPS